MHQLSAFESWIVRSGAALLSRRGRSASLLVVIYHRVTGEPDPLLPGEPDAAHFAAHVALLHQNFNVLPLREAIGQLRRGTLPRRAVCITFDDGYANNIEVALPILRARGVPATVFVAPGFLNGGRMFNDTIIESVRSCISGKLDLSSEGFGVLDLSMPAARLAAIERLIGALKYLPPAERTRRARAIGVSAGISPRSDLMMSDAQVLELHRAGIEIGAHTMTHPILTQIDPQTAWEEIIESKRRLEEITGAPVRSFAYPNGRPERDYRRIHVEFARKAGFELALSTSWGAATARSDPYQVPRIAPWDRSARRYALRMAASYRSRAFSTV